MPNILMLHLQPQSEWFKAVKIGSSFGKQTSGDGHENCDASVIINKVVHITIILGHV